MENAQPSHEIMSIRKLVVHICNCIFIKLTHSVLPFLQSKCRFIFVIFYVVDTTQIIEFSDQKRQTNLPILWNISNQNSQYSWLLVVLIMEE